VLSHCSHQHLHNLLLTYPPTLDQTDHHAYIADGVGIEAHLLPIPWALVNGGPTRVIRPPLILPMAVLHPLLLFPLQAPVVLHTACGRTLLAVRGLAPKRTAQIPAPGVTRMREEENPTMPTTAETAPQLGLVPDNGAQHHVILPHQRADPLAPPVPIRADLEKFLDLDY